MIRATKIQFGSKGFLECLPKTGLESLIFTNTLSEGIPYNGIVFLTYSWASLSTPQVSQIGRKWVYLVSPSTITWMAFFFEAERGNPVTKFIETKCLMVVVHPQDVDAQIQLLINQTLVDLLYNLFLPIILSKVLS